MPKLWNETISAHRAAVRDAIIDATMELANEHGILSVTMSRIAARAGIGRATLYKYFPDVEAVVLAQHDRQMAGQLEQLHAVRAAGGNPWQQLEQVLRIHARMIYDHHGSSIAAFVHQGTTRAHQHAFLEDILRRAAVAGVVRGDADPAELTRFCLHALSAAAEASSAQAVDRLVRVTLDGLRKGPAGHPSPALD